MEEYWGTRFIWYVYQIVQKRVALALAHLKHDDQRMIFIDNNGLETLLGLYETDSSSNQ